MALPLLFLLTLTYPAFGQAARLPARLSFEEARALFLEYNPDLKAARARAARRTQQALIPALWPNPSLALQRNQVARPGGGFGSENTLAIEQPLRYPGEHQARRRAARDYGTASRARFEEDAAALYLTLRTRYAAAVAARQRLDVLSVITEAVRRAARIGRVHFEEGAARSLELTRLRVALATYENELAAARREHRDARIELAYFLLPRAHAGRHEAEEELLVVTDSLAYRPLVLDYEALTRQALAARGLLEAARAEAQAREHTLQAERQARWPDLAVTAGYRGETQPGLLASGFTLGLRVGLPLFHQRQPQVRAARPAAAVARYETEQARRRVLLQVHDAYERLVSYRRRIERISGELLQGSDQLLKDALYVYEEGAMNLTQLLNAAEAAKTARLLEIELVTQYNLSLYALERALGVGPRDPSPFVE